MLKLEADDISPPSLSSSIVGSGRLRSFACDIRVCECATGDGPSSDGEIVLSTFAGGGGLRRTGEVWIGEGSSSRVVGLTGSSVGTSISGSGWDVPHNSRSTIGSGDERGRGLSDVSHNASGCCDGDRVAPVSRPLCIGSDSRDSDGDEEDDRGVSGLGGGDGLQPASVDDNFGSTIASECASELSSCGGMVWGLNEMGQSIPRRINQK